MRFMLLMITLTIAISAHAKDNRDTLYQVSTINALLAGLYDGVADVGDVIHHGDFGLGTFDQLDGEMIVLEGRVYQAAVDGSVNIMPSSARTPFMAVTYFNADRQLNSPANLKYSEFKTWLESNLPSRNIICGRSGGEIQQHHVSQRTTPRAQTILGAGRSYATSNGLQPGADHRNIDRILVPRFHQGHQCSRVSPAFSIRRPKTRKTRTGFHHGRGYCADRLHRWLGCAVTDGSGISQRKSRRGSQRGITHCRAGWKHRGAQFWPMRPDSRAFNPDSYTAHRHSLSFFGHVDLSPTPPLDS